MLDTNCFPITVSGFQAGTSLFIQRWSCLLQRRMLATSRFSSHCLSTENYSSVERVRSVRPFQRVPNDNVDNLFPKGSHPFQVLFLPRTPPHTNSTPNSRHFWKYFSELWKLFSNSNPRCFWEEECFLIPPSPAKCQMKRSNYDSQASVATR